MIKTVLLALLTIAFIAVMGGLGYAVAWVGRQILRSQP